MKIIFYDANQQTQTILTNALQQANVTETPQFIVETINKDTVDPDAEIISVFTRSKVTKELIEAMPKLKLIACRSTGTDNVDVTAAKEKGITVVNVPGYGQHAVAEYTIGLMIALLRKIPQALEATKEGKTNEPLTGHNLHGKTLGIVGAGAIGQQVAKTANSFGMKVLAFDPLPRPACALDCGFTYVELHELLAKSNIVSLHAPYTGANKHMIGGIEFAKMQPNSFLVNTARGELVDTEALISALEQGKLAGAALDVVEHEALLLEDSSDNILTQLKKLPNVLLTHHNAYNSIEAIELIARITVKNIQNFLQNKPTNTISHEAQAKTEKYLGKLIITRHAESEWNALGKWTGTTDVHLTPKGFHESALLGQALKGTTIDFAYCSQQIRTLETLEGILDASGNISTPYRRHAAINERDYGDLTGKNKWEVKEEIGEEAFQGIRRGWDYPVPNGETLKMVYERAIPFYNTEVLPRLRQGQNVLLVAHGNSIRALMKYLEDISDEGIASVEMPFGEILLYDITLDGLQDSKEVVPIDTTPPNA